MTTLTQENIVRIEKYMTFKYPQVALSLSYVIGSEQFISGRNQIGECISVLVSGNRATIHNFDGDAVANLCLSRQTNLEHICNVLNNLCTDVNTPLGKLDKLNSIV